MKCVQLMVGLILAAVLLPLWFLLESWMLTLVDRADATSVIGFVGWSAFFLYLGVRIILGAVSLGVDKVGPVK